MYPNDAILLLYTLRRIRFLPIRLRIGMRRQKKRKGDFMLDYRYQTFLVLADHLNYTKAASVLSLSQPTVTKHIQFLENDLGIKLSQYQDRNLKLTRKGELLRERLVLINRQINDLLRTLTTYSERPDFTIGVSRTIGEYYIPNHTSLFGKEQSIQWHLLVENTQQLSAFLYQKKIDFALISGPVKSKEFEKLPFFEDEILLVCAPEHPFSGKVVEYDRLSEQHLFLREEGSGVSDTVEKYLHQENHSLNTFHRVSRIGNIQLWKSYIKNNDGIGFLYHLSVEEELKEGSLSTITIKNFSLKQPYYLTYLKQSQKQRDIDAVLTTFFATS